MTIGKLSGQCDFGQKGQSYCSQRGQSCVAKRVKVAWLFHKYRNVDFFVFPCRMRTAEIIFEARIDDRYYQYVIPPATWIPGMVNEYYLTFNNN